MYLLTKLFLGGAIFVLLSTEFAQHLKNSEEIKKTEHAQTTLKKSEHIQELADISSVSNGFETSRNADIKTLPSNMIVPNENITTEDKNKLNKLYMAIKEYFKNNDPTSNPTCVQLASTNFISESDCAVISSKQFEFYKYKSDGIEYTTSNDSKDRIDRIKQNTQSVLESSTNEATLKDGRLVSSQSGLKVKRKIEARQKSLSTFNEYLKEDNLIGAVLVLDKLSYYEPLLSLRYASRIIKKSSAVTNSDDLKFISRKSLNILYQAYANSITIPSSIKTTITTFAKANLTDTEIAQDISNSVEAKNVVKNENLDVDLQTSKFKTFISGL